MLRNVICHGLTPFFLPVLPPFFMTISVRIEENPWHGGHRGSFFARVALL